MRTGGVPRRTRRLHTNGCGADDLGNDAVNASVFWATGAVVEEDGDLELEGEVTEGIFPGDYNFGPGLVDAQKAEIHVVARTHGQVIPGLLEEQLSTFDGGCNPGQANEGKCANIQGAVFAPFGGDDGGDDDDDDDDGGDDDDDD